MQISLNGVMHWCSLLRHCASLVVTPATVWKFWQPQPPGAVRVCVHFTAVGIPLLLLFIKWWLFIYHINLRMYTRFPWITPQQTKHLVGKEIIVHAVKLTSKHISEFYKNIIKYTPKNTDKYMPLDVCFMFSRKLNVTFHFPD
jgi:hypothetical protein